MFWGLLVGLYIVTFPINAVLLRKWYGWYPIQVYQTFGETVYQGEIMKAQFRAILLFGLVQPILATIPLLYGNKWFHYIICLLASAGYSSSGNPKFFLDRVRSSNLMRLATIIAFALGTLLFTQVRADPCNVSDDDYAKAEKIYSILIKYVSIDDEFWLTSSEVFRYNGEYDSLAESLDILSKDLSNIIKSIQGENETQNLLLQYSNALEETIISLRDICRNLVKVTKGQMGSYPYKKYEADMKNYRERIETYKMIGKKLSIHIFGY